MKAVITAVLAVVGTAIAFSLLPGSRAAGQAGAVTSPSVASEAAVPYVLKEEIYIYSTNPGGELFGQRLDARRSDGSTVLEDNVGPIKWGLMGRKVMYMDGRTVSVIDALGTKTTWPSLTGKDGRRQMLSSMQARGCVGSNETLIGHDNISGQEVVVVRPAPMPGPEGPDAPPLRFTEWRAPSLGCQDLVYQFDKKQPDGSWQLMTKSKVISLTLGEPDPELFSVPSTCTELRPSDVMQRVYQKAGVPWDDDAKKSVAREDEAYARK